MPRGSKLDYRGKSKRIHTPDVSCGVGRADSARSMTKRCAQTAVQASNNRRGSLCGRIRRVPARRGIKAERLQTSEPGQSVIIVNTHHLLSCRRDSGSKKRTSASGQCTYDDSRASAAVECTLSDHTRMLFVS